MIFFCFYLIFSDFLNYFCNFSMIFSWLYDVFFIYFSFFFDTLSYLEYFSFDLSFFSAEILTFSIYLRRVFNYFIWECSELRTEFEVLSLYYANPLHKVSYNDYGFFFFPITASLLLVQVVGFVIFGSLLSLSLLIVFFLFFLKNLPNSTGLF